MHGMKRTRESLTDKNDDDDNINKILEHIQGVEDFKHCEDEIQAAAILERYELSLDHVPGHLLKAKEVIEIIYYFQKLKLLQVSNYFLHFYKN